MNTGDFVAYSHGPREGCLKGCRMRGATLEHPCLWGELGMEKRVFLGDRQWRERGKGGANEGSSQNRNEIHLVLPYHHYPWQNLNWKGAQMKCAPDWAPCPWKEQVRKKQTISTDNDYKNSEVVNQFLCWGSAPHKTTTKLKKTVAQLSRLIKYSPICICKYRKYPDPEYKK